MVHSNVLMQAYILQDFGDQPNIPNYKHFRYICITLGCDMYTTSLSTISCMHTITHTHHSDTHLCVHVCKQACKYTYVRTHEHTHTHAHTHTHTHTNTHHDYNSDNKMQTTYICSVEKSSPSMSYYNEYSPIHTNMIYIIICNT